jgi:hypothetical protein
VQAFDFNELTCAQEGSSGLLYSCTSAGHPDYLLLYEGEIFGRGPRQIERVEAWLSVAGAEADLQLTAQSYLGGVASDLVQGEANKDRAFNFVYNDQDITGKTSTMIGGVKSTFTGDASTKALTAVPANGRG